MTLTVKVSETGSVELPKSMREANGWTVGTELELEERGREVVLRPKTKSRREELFPPITIEEFLRRVPKYEGPSITDEMMQEAISKEAKRRWNEESR